MKSRKNKNKIAGAVYGFAIGDAMGATTEFMTKEEIQNKYGIVDNIIGGGWLNLKPGEITDDTQMTLCVMEALQDSVEIGSGVDYFYKLVGANFIKWLDGKPKDVGTQCAIGIAYYKKYGKQRNIVKNECGNGGLMRALPCALINRFDLNIIQNCFTHRNEECLTYLEEYHNIIVDCVCDNNKERYDIHVKYAYLHEPTGYVKNTFENVIWHVSNAKNFSNAIISAVNNGGDADTIGALTGGLAGAIYGYDSIPQKWIDKLDIQIKNKLDEFVEFVVKMK